MALGTLAIWAIIGIIIAFGGLKFVSKFIPGIGGIVKGLEMALGIFAILFLIGLAVGAIGMPGLQNWIANYEWAYGLIVGLLGGTAASSVFSMF